jgi:hypothetical protein
LKIGSIREQGGTQIKTTTELYDPAKPELYRPVQKKQFVTKTVTVRDEEAYRELYNVIIQKRAL